MPNRLWLIPLAALLMGADAPITGLPSLDQLVGASPSVLLGLGLLGLLTGKIVQGYLYDRAEARATAATDAAALSNKTAADALAALDRLTEEHRKEREAFEQELSGLQRELARINAPRRT